MIRIVIHAFYPHKFPFFSLLELEIFYFVRNSLKIRKNWGVVIKNKAKSDLLGLELENQILNLLNLVVLKTF